MSKCLCEDMPYFFGPGTFQNLPYEKAVEEGHDFAVFGLPFDTAAVGRGGARFAPADIRHHPSYNSGLEFNSLLNVMGTEAQGVDLGESDIKMGYTEPTLPIIEEFVLDAIKFGAITIGMGGGQIVTLPELRAMKKKYGPVALIHISAKGSVSDSEQLYDDSNAIRNAIDENLISTANSVQIGLRKQYCEEEDILFSNSKGLQTIFIEDFPEQSYLKPEKKGLDNLINEILELTRDIPCFISLDMNFLDPANAPGVSVPVPGGADTYTLRTLIRALAVKTNMIGFDIVGVVPAYDVGEITAQVADSVISDVISAICLKKRG